MTRRRRSRTRAVCVAGVIASALALAATSCGSSPTCIETASCDDHDRAVADSAPGATDGRGPALGDAALANDAWVWSDAPPNTPDVLLDTTQGDAPPHDATSDVAPGTDACRPEDCTNGVDDDCNGLADCADPSCAPGFVCSPAAPTGWSGPAELFEATGASYPAPPSCPSSFSSDAFDGSADPSAPPATCGCTCGAAGNVVCGAVSVSFYFDGSCNNLCTGGPVSVTPGGACVEGCPGAQTMKAVPSLAHGGACPPHGSKSVSPWMWKRAARLCATAGSPSAGGCSASKVCTARPSAPFSPSLCVWQKGDVACPGAPYSVKHLYFDGATDTRDCSACACDPPTSVTCSGVRVATFADGECPTNPVGSIAASGACVSAPASTSVVQASASTVGAGSCAAKAVAPIGGVTPTGPTTVCCGQ